MSTNVLGLTRALVYAAEAHANQRRKGAAQEPYINHLIEVLDLVARATGGEDGELLIAALLHDVVEDTPISAEELAAAFGARVARIVIENSDDMTLPKDERRRQRIAAMAHKSPEARIVKTADVISNLRAIAVSPPAGWAMDRRLGYLEGCRQLIDAGRGANAVIETLFDQTAADAERAIRADAALEVDGAEVIARHLDSVIGQAVHLVYLPNTSKRAITDADMDRLCETISRSFPSATVQHADAVFDGSRRQILLARIRSDSTDAVVALAQRLCIVFDQRFVGIEVSGRYIRVYADDTG
ncbi:HD domain-containing protein [Pseudochelatococcus lubricantis]|uniref:HD domain-containing protein n=1 Tax=Pseudochelatococcus lubricantis TaxID=1538102 RepID=UPI0035E9ECD9